MIKQISIFVENKPGRLKAMTNILKGRRLYRYYYRCACSRR